MRPTINLRAAGILLVAVSLLAGIGFQWLGPGLVTIEHPVALPSMLSQGIVEISRTTVSLLSLPLLSAALVGIACLCAPRRAV